MEQSLQCNSSRTLTGGWLAVIIVVAVIIADQLLKIWIKTNFYLGESFEILPFFELRFVQNNGMAFGMEFGSKLLLTLFRIAVVGVLAGYIYKLCRQPSISRGYVATLACITAGALGNIIDCVFYGLIFSNPYPCEVAQFVPWGEGYAGVFHGLVVDMLYFPLFSFEWPEWLPLVGGETFSFFDPVFNIADAAISVGIVVLLLFYTKHLPFSDDNLKNDEAKDSQDAKNNA